MLLFAQSDDLVCFTTGHLRMICFSKISHPRFVLCLLSSRTFESLPCQAAASLVATTGSCERSGPWVSGALPGTLKILDLGSFRPGRKQGQLAWFPRRAAPAYIHPPKERAVGLVHATGNCKANTKITDVTAFAFCLCVFNLQFYDVTLPHWMVE